MREFARNGVLYLINVILFVLIYIAKPPGMTWLIGLLILMLLLSFAKSNRRRGKRNVWHIVRLEIINWNSLIMLIVFLPNLVLYWAEYLIIGKVYLIVFCLIQIASVKVAIKRDQERDVQLEAHN